MLQSLHPAASMLIIGFVLLLVAETTSKKQLKQVNIVFRHGDRTPVHTFAGDPNTEATWPQGLGQLTVKGMKQQFELGQFLRARYIESPLPLLGPSYNRSHVFVRSTDIDRTLMSAQCQLAGLFPPSEGQVWNPSMLWQPIPVHTQSLKGDYLLYTDIYCAKWSRLWHEDVERGSISKFVNTNRALLDWISNQSGVPFASLRALTDTLNVELLYGRIVPPWANASVLSLLHQLEDLSFTEMFAGVDKSRLRGGFLLRHLLDSMEAADTTSTKLFLYSAHDSTVIALLSALQVFDGVIPPYASAVLVELWQEDSSSVVKVFYKRGVTDLDPQLLTVPGCNSACPLGQLRGISRDHLPEKEFDEECENPSPTEDRSTFPKVMLVAITTCTVGALVLLLVHMLRYACRWRRLCRRF